MSNVFIIFFFVDSFAQKHGWSRSTEYNDELFNGDVGARPRTAPTPLACPPPTRENSLFQTVSTDLSTVNRLTNSLQGERHAASFGSIATVIRITRTSRHFSYLLTFRINNASRTDCNTQTSKPSQTQTKKPSSKLLVPR